MLYQTINDFQFFAYKIKLNKLCGVAEANPHFIWSEYESAMWRSLERIPLAILSEFKTSHQTTISFGVGWDLFIK